MLSDIEMKNNNHKKSHIYCVNVHIPRLYIAIISFEVWLTFFFFVCIDIDEHNKTAKLR